MLQIVTKKLNLKLYGTFRILIQAIIFLSLAASVGVSKAPNSTEITECLIISVNHSSLSNEKQQLDAQFTIENRCESEVLLDFVAVDILLTNQDDQVLQNHNKASVITPSIKVLSVPGDGEIVYRTRFELVDGAGSALPSGAYKIIGAILRDEVISTVEIPLVLGNTNRQ